MINLRYLSRSRELNTIHLYHAIKSFTPNIIVRNSFTGSIIFRQRLSPPNALLHQSLSTARTRSSSSDWQLSVGGAAKRWKSMEKLPALAPEVLKFLPDLLSHINANQTKYSTEHVLMLISGASTKEPVNNIKRLIRFCQIRLGTLHSEGHTFTRVEWESLVSSLERMCPNASSEELGYLLTEVIRLLKLSTVHGASQPLLSLPLRATATTPAPAPAAAAPSLAEVVAHTELIARLVTCTSKLIIHNSSYMPAKSLAANRESLNRMLGAAEAMLRDVSADLSSTATITAAGATAPGTTTAVGAAAPAAAVRGWSKAVAVGRGRPPRRVDATRSEGTSPLTADAKTLSSLCTSAKNPNPSIIGLLGRLLQSLRDVFATGLLDTDIVDGFLDNIQYKLHVCIDDMVGNYGVNCKVHFSKQDLASLFAGLRGFSSNNRMVRQLCTRASEILMISHCEWDRRVIYAVFGCLPLFSCAHEPVRQLLLVIADRLFLPVDYDSVWDASENSPDEDIEFYRSDAEPWHQISEEGDPLGARIGPASYRPNYNPRHNYNNSSNSRRARHAESPDALAALPPRTSTRRPLASPPSPADMRLRRLVRGQLGVSLAADVTPTVLLSAAACLRSMPSDVLEVRRLLRSLDSAMIIVANQSPPPRTHEEGSIDRSGGSIAAPTSTTAVSSSAAQSLFDSSFAGNVTQSLQFPSAAFSSSLKNPSFDDLGMRDALFLCRAVDIMNGDHEEVRRMYLHIAQALDSATTKHCRDVTRLTTAAVAATAQIESVSVESAAASSFADTKMRVTPMAKTKQSVDRSNSEIHPLPTIGAVLLASQWLQCANVYHSELRQLLGAFVRAVQGIFYVAAPATAASSPNSSAVNCFAPSGKFFDGSAMILDSKQVQRSLQRWIKLLSYCYQINSDFRESKQLLFLVISALRSLRATLPGLQLNPNQMADAINGTRSMSLENRETQLLLSEICEMSTFDITAAAAAASAGTEVGDKERARPLGYNKTWVKLGWPVAQSERSSIHAAILQLGHFEYTASSRDDLRKFDARVLQQLKAKLQQVVQMTTLHDSMTVTASAADAADAAGAAGAADAGDAGASTPLAAVEGAALDASPGGHAADSASGQQQDRTSNERQISPAAPSYMSQQRGVISKDLKLTSDSIKLRCRAGDPFANVAERGYFQIAQAALADLPCITVLHNVHLGHLESDIVILASKKSPNPTSEGPSTAAADRRTKVGAASSADAAADAAADESYHFVLNIELDGEDHTTPSARHKGTLRDEAIQGLGVEVVRWDISLTNNPSQLQINHEDDNILIASKFRSIVVRKMKKFGLL